VTPWSCFPCWLTLTIGVEFGKLTHTSRAYAEPVVLQFVGNLYQAGLRYRTRMEQINEFSKFHSLSAVLADNIRKYVSFSFAVTNGINADAIGAAS
jgi:hypothetical protein